MTSEEMERMKTRQTWTPIIFTWIPCFISEQGQGHKILFTPPPMYKKYSNMALNLRKYWIEHLNCDSCCNVLDTAKSSYTVSAVSRIPQIMLKKTVLLTITLPVSASILTVPVCNLPVSACPCHLPTSIWPIAASYLTVSGLSLPATY